MPTDDGVPTVLVTWDHLAEPGPRILRDAGCEVLFLTGAKDAAEVAELLRTKPIDAVISRTVPLEADALRSCPTLKVISKHGTGVNNIDVAAATALGIPVTSTPGANAQSVAELTVGLMLAAARRIAWLDDQVRHGTWARVQDGCQLAGRTLGLVGFGQVGRRVAAVALAMGMDVVTFDPVLGDDAPEGVRACANLREVLAVADVLSLHVPLTERTRGLLGAEELALLPEGAIVVNTARGPVIDEPALVDALRSGRLRAAGLDTLAVEPAELGNPLLDLPNVVLTPHVGGSTADSVTAVATEAAANAVIVLRGESVARHKQVNPEAFGHLVP
jgi:D-3-phosphoglycerate dehydrogenase / 2-oxoglutarate reductase